MFKLEYKKLYMKARVSLYIHDQINIKDCLMDKLFSFLIDYL